MKTRAFFRGFFLTVLVMLPIYAGIIMWQYTGGQTVGNTTVQAEINMPGAEDFKTVFLMAESESGISCVLLRLDAMQSKFSVSALPEETVVLVNGNAKTIAEALAYGGPAYASAALAQTLSLRIDHYIYAQSSTMGAFAAKLGTVQVNTPEEVVATAAAGYEIYRRQAGLALLSGEEAVNILKYCAFTPAQRVAFVQEVYAGLLRKNLADLAGILPDAYRAKSHLVTTNLLAQDVYRYERILNFLARQSPAITLKAVPGSWNDTRFELTEESLGFILENFG